MSQRVHEVLARDAFGRWRRMISSATESVTVFSPYLDRLVVGLLRSSSLPPSAVTVVTDVSPTSGATDYWAQLLAVKALLDAGFVVKSLERMHAKVLLVDRARVTIGSQNFTSYARRSREVTVVPADDIAGTAALGTLETWIRTATNVTAEFIDVLLNRLDTQARAVRRADQELLAAFVETSEAFDADERERTRRRWERRIDQSAARHGKISASSERICVASGGR